MCRVMDTTLRVVAQSANPKHETAVDEQPERFSRNIQPVEKRIGARFSLVGAAAGADGEDVNPNLATSI